MWIATRNQHGELIPLDQLDDEALTCLAIEAGLQGMSLAEWMVEVLRVSLDREERLADKEPKRDGYGEPCVELDIEPELMEKLTRYYWTHVDYASPGDALGCMLYYVGAPWHVSLAERLRGTCPKKVAGALIDESHRHGEIDFRQMDRMEAIDKKAFKQALEAGWYDAPLQIAGVAREMQDVPGRSRRRQVATLVA